jgi:hypothetical protein
MFTSGVRTHYVALARCAPLLMATPGSLAVTVSVAIPEAELGAYGAAYAMAKAADDRLALAAAAQLKKHEVASAAVHPGWVRTEGVLLYADRLDLTHSQSPEGVGRAIAALASDPRLLNLTGRATSVDELAARCGTDVSSWPGQLKVLAQPSTSRLPPRTGPRRPPADAGEIDWDALAQRWDATIGGELAGIALTVSNTRGHGASAPAGDRGRKPGGLEPTGPPSREAQERALHKALVLVSDKHPAWTRHDLLKQLALVMPPETRHMDAAAAHELLLGLAEEALSGRAGDVVSLEAPEWPPLPASLRRELDGRSVYTRPGVMRYATGAQLSMEDKLVAQAQAQSAPRLTRVQAAQRLGADPVLLEAQLRVRAQDAGNQATRRGLRLDQAAAIWHVLTSSRAAEVITGPAGTGKTRALAAAAHAWGGPVVGSTATSQNATNELRQAGVTVAANTSQLIAGLGSIRPGSLILVDEGSMVSMAHLAALVDHAGRNGCKLVLAGTSSSSPLLRAAAR